MYGSDALDIRELAAGDPKLLQPIHPDLTYSEAEVIWAARHEMARTVEDVLSRRTRALFLNAKAAIDLAPRVAGILARELNHDEQWIAEQLQSFNALAQGYLVD